MELCKSWQKETTTWLTTLSASTPTDSSSWVVNTSLVVLRRMFPLSHFIFIFLHIFWYFFLYNILYFYYYFFFLFREVNMVAQVYALRWHGHYFNEWLSLLEICFDWSVRFVCIVYQRINNILITVSKRKAWWYVGFVY